MVRNDLLPATFRHFNKWLETLNLLLSKHYWLCRYNLRVTTGDKLRRFVHRAGVGHPITVTLQSSLHGILVFTWNSEASLSDVSLMGFSLPLHWSGALGDWYKCLFHLPASSLHIMDLPESYYIIPNTMTSTYLALKYFEKLFSEF